MPTFWWCLTQAPPNFQNYFIIIIHMRWVLRSKIHQATITEAELSYVGSITIDEELTEKVGLWEGEKVLITNSTTGVRLETYVIFGKRGSGIICANGPAVHLLKVGEKVVIMGFELTDKPIEAKKIELDENNRFVKYL